LKFSKSLLQSRVIRIKLDISLTDSIIGVYLGIYPIAFYTDPIAFYTDPIGVYMHLSYRLPSRSYRVCKINIKNKKYSFQKPKPKLGIWMSYRNEY
jgi:hypothetical protein